MRVQEFASYARFVKGRKQSGGRLLGTSDGKGEPDLGGGAHRREIIVEVGDRPLAPHVRCDMRRPRLVRPGVRLRREAPSCGLMQVAEAIWIPLDPLMHGRLRTTLAHERDEERTLSPAHDVDGRIVWGLTYRRLEGLFALLR